MPFHLSYAESLSAVPGSVKDFPHSFVVRERKTVMLIVDLGFQMLLRANQI